MPWLIRFVLLKVNSPKRSAFPVYLLIDEHSMRSTLLLMVASAVFGSSLAIAQSTLANAPENKKPHALSKFTERFAAADQNGDGALTRSEADAAGISRIVKHFDRLDANGDGKVTPEEVRALLRQRPIT